MRRWTTEEIDVLKENYGIEPIELICTITGRTENAVNSKACKLGLTMKEAGESFTVTDFCSVTNISRTTVEYWIRECGFPAKKLKHRSKKYRKIKSHLFWKWAELNKHRIQWNEFPKYCLGVEPKWVEDARKVTAEKITKRRPWSSWEINELEYLLKQEKYTYPELSEKLNRTHGAIKRKIYDLQLPWPIYLPKHTEKYTVDEIESAVEMYKYGHPLAAIAKKLNRSELGLRSKLERSGYQFVSKKIIQKEEDAACQK